MMHVRTTTIQIIEAIDPDAAEYRVQISVCKDGKEHMLLKADHPASMQANSIEPLEACKGIFQWFANNPKL